MVRFQLKLVLALAFDVVHLVILWVENGHINVHVRPALKHCKRPVDNRSLMNILVETLYFARRQVKRDTIRPVARST